MATQNTLIVVLGPTAVGKTAFAISLAKHFGAEIISADSRQFYRELKIGVARPSESELKEAPHYFIGFLPVEEHYSAGQYSREAGEKMDELFQKNSVVIAVGGSMLYLDALINGFDDLPDDPGVREAIEKKYASGGIEFLRNRLMELDPEFYNMVDISNPRRLMRAIEVCEVSGKKYSDLRKNERKINHFRTIKIGLTAQRNNLYKNINQRVDSMMAEGLLAEVEAMLPNRHLNALNTVGYKELFDHLDGRLSLDEACDKIKQHTRNFAKRQLTWWRRDESIHWLDVTSETPQVDFAEFLLNQK